MYPLINKFETRKVVFKAEDNEKRLKAGILKAMEFEVLYLQNKCEFYDRMANEDKEYDATIISSDKDLLQLICDDVNVKLLKQKDYIKKSISIMIYHFYFSILISCILSLKI